MTIRTATLPSIYVIGWLPVVFCHRSMFSSPRSRAGSTGVSANAVTIRTTGCYAGSSSGTSCRACGRTPPSGRCVPPPSPTPPANSPEPKRQFTGAQTFLTWLHDEHLEPGRLSQHDLDTWTTSHLAHERYDAQGFLTWAVDHGHLPSHLDIPRVKFNIGPAITQQRRLTLLRRYLADDQESVPVRVAACLLLLYAQPLSRILRLTHRDLIEDDGELFIRLGDPPSPVPDPLAHLLRRLTPTALEDAWLFPGKNPGQPLTHRTLFLKLRRLGFPLGEARVSALRQLVLQAPAPVIAAALGVHHTTTTRQANNAGATWSRYAARGHDPAS